MGMRIFGGQDIMLEYRDKLSVVRKTLALGPTPMLPDTFELDGWKNGGLRSYRTVGEARTATAP